MPGQRGAIIIPLSVRVPRRLCQSAKSQNGDLSDAGIEPAGPGLRFFCFHLELSRVSQVTRAFFDDSSSFRLPLSLRHWHLQLLQLSPHRSASRYALIIHMRMLPPHLRHNNQPPHRRPTTIELALVVCAGGWIVGLGRMAARRGVATTATRLPDGASRIFYVLDGGAGTTVPLPAARRGQPYFLCFGWMGSVRRYHPRRPDGASRIFYVVTTTGQRPSS